MALEDEIAPTLGGPLELSNEKVTSTGDAHVDIEGSFIVDLGDLGGVKEFRVRDSSGQDVLRISSTGDLIVEGAVYDTAGDPISGPIGATGPTGPAGASDTPEGTAVLSTGEGGGSKFLREDGDGTSSWQTITGGGDALVANPLSQFAATTSAQLAGVISDETGTGVIVLATSPTLVTPALGTPSAIVLTNATGSAAGIDSDSATHIASNGSDHSFIDQDVTSGSGPAFTSIQLTTPVLGTPTSGVATNLTGTASGLTAGSVTNNANLTGHITSAGNATVLGSFTVSQLSTALSDATLSGNNSGDEAASSATVSGVVELATIAEVDTGTDTVRAITPAGLAGSALQTKVDGVEALADVTDAANVGSALTLTGDVTSSGSMATTIAAGAVDVAMLANGTDGELITWDASGVAAAVAVGTSTHVLTSNGTGAAPTFQAAAGGGDVVKLATATASSDTSIDFTDSSYFDGTYSRLELVGERVAPASDAALALIRYSTSSTWRATSYDGGFHYTADSTNTHIALGTTGGKIAGNTGNSTDENLSFKASILGPSTTGFKAGLANCFNVNSANLEMACYSAFRYKGDTTALDGIRFIFSSGNIASGEFTLYGYK